MLKKTYPEPWNYSSFYQFHAQKALFKVPKICNINFWIENDPPPLWNFSEYSSALAAPPVPNGGGLEVMVKEEMCKEFNTTFTWRSMKTWLGRPFLIEPKMASKLVRPTYSLLSNLSCFCHRVYWTQVRLLHAFPHSTARSDRLDAFDTGTMSLDFKSWKPSLMSTYWNWRLTVLMCNNCCWYGCGIVSFPNPLALESELVLWTPWEHLIWLWSRFSRRKCILTTGLGALLESYRHE